MDGPRSAGIAGAEDLGWGGCVCCFTRGYGETTEVLAEYLTAGLEGNELCVWYMVDAPDDARTAGALREVIPGIDTYLERGQLEFAREATLLHEGVLDQRKLSADVTDRLGKSLAGGFAGLRVAVSSSRLADAIVTMREERERHAAAGAGQPRVAFLCAYGLEGCDVAAALKAVAACDLTLVRGARGWQTIASRSGGPSQAPAVEPGPVDRDLADYLGDIFFVLDKDLKCTYWNKAAENPAGTPAEEAIGKSVYDLFPGLAGTIPEKMYLEVLRTHRPQNFIDEYRIGGKRAFLEISAYPLQDGVSVYLRDISWRRRIEDVLKAAAQEWRTTFDAISDPVCLLDSAGHVRRCNAAMARLLDRPFSEIIGRSCHRLIHGTDEPIADCPLVRMRESMRREVSVIQQDDRWYEVSVHPLLDAAGNLTGAVHITSDITARKKLEAQLLHMQKIDAIGQLAGGVAHDFNNILTAIIGHSSILQAKMAEDDPLRAHVDRIMAASESAASVTHSLLAFGRKEVVNLKPLKLCGVVDDAAKLLTRLIGESIELVVTQSDDDPSVLADKSQMEQLLINLATNARDAMPQGGRLEITTEVAALDSEFLKGHGYGEAGLYALITVTDTGVGMDEKTVQKMYEPFFTTKGPGHGTGLGLSIAYGVVKQHRGYIDCVSRPGEGTAFKVYLPITTVPVAPAKDAMRAVPEGGTETVLLAEDEADVRGVTKKALEELGYDVIEAEDGEAAIARFMENRDRIRLLVFDVVMPKKDGKEAYDEIRKVKPDVKALFTSGYAPSVLEKKGIFSEKLHFVPKPLSPQELLVKVRETLDE